jgi:hypothetical protein
MTSKPKPCFAFWKVAFSAFLPLAETSPFSTHELPRIPLNQKMFGIKQQSKFNSCKIEEDTVMMISDHIFIYPSMQFRSPPSGDE